MHRSDPTRLQQHALLMCERIDTAVRLMGHMEDGLSRDNLGRGRNPRGQPRPGPQGQGQGQREGYAQNRLSSSGSFSRPFMVRRLLLLPFACLFFDIRCAEAMMNCAAGIPFIVCIATIFQIKPYYDKLTCTTGGSYSQSRRLCAHTFKHARTHARTLISTST